VPADAISVPADSASEIVKCTISIPCESCTNAKAKYSSSVVPPDPSVHFYHYSVVCFFSVLFFSRSRSEGATPWTYFLHVSLSSVILADFSTGSPVHAGMRKLEKRQ